MPVSSGQNFKEHVIQYIPGILELANLQELHSSLRWPNQDSMWGWSPYIHLLHLTYYMCFLLSDFCPEQNLIPSGSNFLLFYETKKTFDNSRFIILMSKIHDSCWHPLTKSSQFLHQIKIASLHQFLLQRCATVSPAKKTWLKTLRRWFQHSGKHIISRVTVNIRIPSMNKQEPRIESTPCFYPTCLGTFSLSPCQF